MELRTAAAGLEGAADAGGAADAEPEGAADGAPLAAGSVAADGPGAEALLPGAAPDPAAPGAFPSSGLAPMYMKTAINAPSTATAMAA